MHEARKRALDSDSNEDYLEKVPDELISNHLPVSIGMD